MKQTKTFAHVKSEAKLARQALIIEAAERVFAVKPFNKVSIRDIAREADLEFIEWAAAMARRQGAGS